MHFKLILAFVEDTETKSVMEAARLKAADRAPAAEASRTTSDRAAPPREAEEEDPGLWGSLLHWVGGLAMRPQLAMAMMLFLMVGLGLWLTVIQINGYLAAA